MRSETKGQQANTKIPAGFKINRCAPTSRPETQYVQDAETGAMRRVPKYLTLPSVKVLRETDKAILVETKYTGSFDADAKPVTTRPFKVWVPRVKVLLGSTVKKTGDVGKLVIPDWIINRTAKADPRDPDDTRTARERYMDAVDTARDAGLSEAEAHNQARTLE